MVVASGLIVLGLVVLVVGGDLLVRGASGIASLMGISPLVIGLTVVAFGTSAPELAVSLSASSGDAAEIAVGNVLGSNIFNVLFILGISALVTPLSVASQLVRLEVPFMVGVSLLLWMLSMNGHLGHVEGSLLFGMLLVYIVWSVWQSRRESKKVVEEYKEEFDKPPKSLWDSLLQLVWIVLGLIGLAYGSQWLVDGAVMIAKSFNMSELLIGLTIVAVGTSLPEVVASVMASIKGERDIAVGNVVGSNLFNMMCVLGLTAIVVPEGVPVPQTAIWQEFPVMIAVCAVCLPIFFTGGRIERWEGAILFGYYILYTTYLVLGAVGSPYAPILGKVMLFGLVPLTVLVLTISVLTALRRKPESPVSEGIEEADAG
ncbi:sodium:calcium antiporter [Bremerella cremea]|uniref:Sodium:calcium antiporter n=1 Tax=Bremerella cremea TaxID=1031537 RepID=A0A368KZQ8_9BACT|nr:calcium/sodium antiporter [Bremerella cremea]RCS55994.1 sodium:calcium antiporter [Bremerella cremea]